MIERRERWELEKKIVKISNSELLLRKRGWIEMYKYKRHFKEETIACYDLVEENGSENTDSNMPALEMTKYL